MNIIVGLGNPGQKYCFTKHNFGFWVVDKFVERSSLIFKAGSGDYIIAKKQNLMCIKPTTFMNNSGNALLNMKQFFKIDIKDILVIYDDIDLPLGTIRLRESGGSGGHKGIESIISQLQSENFKRLRIGIATDENMRPSEKFVLSPFREQDEILVQMAIDKACDCINYYINYDIKETMNKYNEKNREKLNE